MRFAALCKALAHPARVAILRFLIQRKECVCGEIVDVLPLAQSTVSEHLRVLKEAGLVKGAIDGPRVCYCANPDTVRELGRHFAALLKSPRTGRQAPAERQIRSPAGARLSP